MKILIILANRIFMRGTPLHKTEGKLMLSSIRA